MSGEANGGPLRIVFLAGGCKKSTLLSVERVCRLAGVKPLAVLLDTGRPALGRRFRNLRGNIAREGAGYVWFRALGALRGIADNLVKRAVAPRPQAIELLRRAFPDRCFSLEDLGRKYGFPVLRAGNLNGADAVRLLSSLDADLGVVLGTRILKPAAFSIPRLGCINLHKGKLPEYRGTPPGFWEIYEGEATAGVSVHFVDATLDTGDIVASAGVPILPADTPDTLVEKLHEAGSQLLAGAVTAIQAGTFTRVPQPRSSLSRSGTANEAGTVVWKSRRKPLRKQVEELHRRLPHWRRHSAAARLAKNLYCLAAYYLGAYALARAAHAFQGSRAAVVLYHRVDDVSKDVLTVDTETFAGQILAVKKRYAAISTFELVESIHGRKPVRPTSVAIHFDDCYRSVATDGAPILRAAEFPATAFIASGFVDTNRVCTHDRNRPFTYANLRREDILDWIGHGFEIGAHTVNHADLGTCGDEEARFEILESKRQLEEISGKRVTVFSFPFGKLANIRPEVRELIRGAGFQGLFSAHGGFVKPDTDPYDIPRLGGSGEHEPLYLLLEIEGIAPANITARLKRLFSRA